MTPHVSSHHRLTIEKIFHHPAGKFAVTLGPETEVFEAPRGKDIDEQVTVDLRRMLRQAGYEPDGAKPVPDTRQRDHGDGQRGEPG